MEISGGLTMKNNYFIPGFEPDEIRDMAKSALKQAHESKVNFIKHDCDELNCTLLNVQITNLNRSNATGVSAGYRSFHQDHLVTNDHQKYEANVAINEFVRQLDSADHGKNVVARTKVLSSKKVAQ